jgi:hypothetical protein
MAARNYPATRSRPVKPASPAVVAKLERDLTTMTKRYKAATERLRIERDRVIVDAHAGGVTPTRIAEITGLSPQRIAQIRKPDLT